MGEAFDEFVVDELFDDSEAIETGHLDIEEDDVGLMFFNEGDGFDAVGAFGQDFDGTGGVEEELELFAGEQLVVDDEGSDGRDGRS